MIRDRSIIFILHYWTFFHRTSKKKERKLEDSQLTNIRV